MEYRVVMTVDKKIDEFVENVRTLIAQGWEPQGGISQMMTFTEEKLVIFCAQAMIKK